MAFSKTIEEKKLIIQCDACFEEITLHPFIKCAGCVWDLCTSCFLKNIETNHHKKNHGYRIINNLEKPLFEKSWRVLDELLFLDGIINYGICNFEDISLILSRSIDDVKTHFFNLTNITNNEKGENKVSENFIKKLPNKFAENFQKKLISQKKIENINLEVLNLEIYPRIKFENEKLETYKTKINEHQGKVQALKSDPYDQEVLSYMPLRKDFESEIINDYEGIISSLQFSLNDPVSIQRLKKAMLDTYRIVLQQRRMWKHFVLNRNLVSVHKIKKNVTSSGISKIIDKHKWLAPYLSRNDFNYYMSCLREEYFLRKSLSEKTKSNIFSTDITNINNIFDNCEKNFCEKLNIDLETYADIKAYAIESYIMKKPFKKKLFSFFDASEHERAELLYKWFESQNITHPES